MELEVGNVDGLHVYGSDQEVLSHDETFGTVVVEERLDDQVHLDGSNGDVNVEGLDNGEEHDEGI